MPTQQTGTPAAISHGLYILCVISRDLLQSERNDRSDGRWLGDNGGGPGTVSYIPACVANQALFCASDFTPVSVYSSSLHSAFHVVIPLHKTEPASFLSLPPAAIRRGSCVHGCTMQENGATMLVPGSHLAGRHPSKHEAAEGGKAAGKHYCAITCKTSPRH